VRFHKNNNISQNFSNGNIDSENIRSNINIESISNIESDNESIYSVISDAEKVNKNNKTQKKNARKNNDNIEITEEIRKKILEMKLNNTTPKKIQYDIKRYNNYNITQQQKTNFNLRFPSNQISNS
jgi:hypothetical protein